jgi:hypothetical protein
MGFFIKIENLDLWATLLTIQAKIENIRRETGRGLEVSLF